MSAIAVTAGKRFQKVLALDFGKGRYGIFEFHSGRPRLQFVRKSRDSGGVFVAKEL